MAEEERVQSAYAVSDLIGAALVVGVSAYFARPLLGPVGTDVTDPAIKTTALLPVVLWCGGWPIALGYNRRLNWTFGCALLLVHIAVAFHLGHGWSHAHAWEHTREVGGYGNGVFVNYAFAAAWYADAFWALAAFDSYRNRPRWLNWGVHGFLAFVVFNAAIVFGSWESRRAFVVMFLLVIAFMLLSRSKLLRPVDAPPAG